MTGLLDVNVLVALFDQDHVFNDAAHIWLGVNSSQGIATCPLTENGLIRILSHPGYSKQLQLPPGEVIRRLDNFLAEQQHRFWEDHLSLRDPAHFAQSRILGSKQLTDIYLLGLAVHHGGRLVTFDRNIPLEAVIGASAEHLEIIGNSNRETNTP